MRTANFHLILLSRAYQMVSIVDFIKNVKKKKK